MKSLGVWDSPVLKLQILNKFAVHTPKTSALYMTYITLRRSLTGFYLPIIGGIAFYLGLGIALIIIFLKHTGQGITRPNEIFLPVFSPALVLMAIYTVYRYWKNTPIVTVTNDHIWFNSEGFLLSDIQKIEFTGKRGFSYIVQFPMEALTLYFPDGKPRQIFDYGYHNYWVLKQYLEQVVIKKQGFVVQRCLPVDEAEAMVENFDTFRNSLFLSFRGILFLCLMGIFLFVLSKGKIDAIVPVFFLFVFWFAITFWQMHYLKVSDRFLMVNNHILFWKRKIYRLSEIREVVFETHGKMPNCLRVITKDFRTIVYPAASLRDATWLALKDKLESHQIQVRNECI